VNADGVDQSCAVTVRSFLESAVSMRIGRLREVARKESRVFEAGVEAECLGPWRNSMNIIYHYDCQIRHVRYEYRTTKCLYQVSGVGFVHALTFGLAVEDKDRLSEAGMSGVGPIWG